MIAIANESEYGRYELLAKIGEGPRGPVFVARAAGEAEPSYVVELSAFASGEDEALRAFRRDVARAQQIEHRNVLAIRATGTGTAGPYVVMDHVEGATLAEVQERHRVIRPPRLVIATVLDALHGLAAAHALPGGPLLHGALSPEVVLIGTDGVARLAGFGNVRPRVQTRPSHRTRGSVGYLAPEQLTGAAIDARADVFAIGVVLWNALTGKRLFHDRIEHVTMSNVLEREVPRPSRVGLTPPAALDGVVLKALARDPARRFASARELAVALTEVARDAGCLAAAPEVGEWITTTFGGELAARRRQLRELAHRPRRSTEVSVLARLGGGPPADGGARDELTVEELAAAAAAAAAAKPAAVARAASRRSIAMVGVAAFAVVAGVLGWRWSAAAAVAPIAALEVTVLDVHPMAPPVAPVAPVVMAPAATPTVAVAPIAATVAPIAPIAPAPTRRAAVHAKQRPRLAPPREAREAREAPTPPPAKPDQRPTLESNPYLYR